MLFYLVVKKQHRRDVMAALKHKGNIAELCVDKWKELMK
jgi:hypothetical protein